MLIIMSLGSFPHGPHVVLTAMAVSGASVRGVL